MKPSEVLLLVSIACYVAGYLWPDLSTWTRNGFYICGMLTIVASIVLGRMERRKENR